jgi:hypothetical protein
MWLCNSQDRKTELLPPIFFKNLVNEKKKALPKDALYCPRVESNIASSELYF